MPKFSISISQEAADKMEELAKKDGKTFSAEVDCALLAYAPKNAPSSSQPQTPVPSPSSGSNGSPSPTPSTTGTDPRIDSLIEQVNALNQECEALRMQSPARFAALEKRVGDLDARLGKLWHDVHVH